MSKLDKKVLTSLKEIDFIDTNTHSIDSFDSLTNEILSHCSHDENKLVHIMASAFDDAIYYKSLLRDLSNITKPHVIIDKIKVSQVNNRIECQYSCSEKEYSCEWGQNSSDINSEFWNTLETSLNSEDYELYIIKEEYLCYLPVKTIELLNKYKSNDKNNFFGEDSPLSSLGISLVNETEYDATLEKFEAEHLGQKVTSLTPQLMRKYPGSFTWFLGPEGTPLDKYSTPLGALHYMPRYYKGYKYSGFIKNPLSLCRYLALCKPESKIAFDLNFKVLMVYLERTDKIWQDFLIIEQEGNRRILRKEGAMILFGFQKNDLDELLPELPSDFTEPDNI